MNVHQIIKHADDKEHRNGEYGRLQKWQKGVTRAEWKAKNGAGSDTMSSQDVTPQSKLCLFIKITHRYI